MTRFTPPSALKFGQVCLLSLVWGLLPVGLAASSCVDLYQQERHQEAVSVCSQEAMKGSALGQYHLGLLFEQGLGTPEDFPTAVMWYRRAASQGLAVAQNKMGELELLRLNRPKEAYQWYLKSSSQGNLEGTLQLGIFFRDGVWVQKDLDKAETLIGRSAQRGYPRAQLQMARLYLDQPSMKDVRQALHWLTRAASNHMIEAQADGIAEAQFELGKIHLEGVDLPVNVAEGVAWLRRSAANGHNPARVMLGELLLQGEVVPQDAAEGVLLLTTAHEQGDAQAALVLGRIYAEGLPGFPQDFKQAIFWYTLGADREDVLVQLTLADLHRQLQDWEGAVLWYQRAVNQGSPEALYQLGMLYLQPEGPGPDPVKALDLLLQAAREGVVAAQHQVGRMYETGWGTRVNLTEARFWYQEAADRGDEDAQLALERLDRMP